MTEEFSSKEEQEKLKAEAESKKEEPEDKKENRGRKRKEVIQEEEKAKQFGSTVSNLGSFSFGLLVARLFPNQPLSPEESDALNKAVEAVAIKYVGVVGQYQEEAGLILCLGFIFLPRYLASKEEKEKLKKEIEKEKIDEL